MCCNLDPTMLDRHYHRSIPFRTTNQWQWPYLLFVDLESCSSQQLYWHMTPLSNDSLIWLINTVLKRPINTCANITVITVASDPKWAATNSVGTQMGSWINTRQPAWEAWHFIVNLTLMQPRKGPKSLAECFSPTNAAVRIGGRPEVRWISGLDQTERINIQTWKMEWLTSEHWWVRFSSTI